MKKRAPEPEQCPLYDGSAALGSKLNPFNISEIPSAFSHAVPACFSEIPSAQGYYKISPIQNNNPIQNKLSPIQNKNAKLQGYYKIFLAGALASKALNWWCSTKNIISMLNQYVFKFRTYSLAETF